MKPAGDPVVPTRRGQVGQTSSKPDMHRRADDVHCADTAPGPGSMPAGTGESPGRVAGPV
jgi:hypothetical protein